ncbi:RagB/SusD family nutrient uptake outer membrane protein [Polaribacter filamentus]|uniref:RagB/SusD family nutrient uptake outer membrane protein n=1 Tax=Polaribacter filamentus TaxID=53483 RepID=UPI000CF2FD86|nr:RagB/SusD family nutrient uptake outer membrane protein [Polaribacter filamentus]
MCPGKFLDTESTATRRFGNDYILLRYADVLLMIAEAQNEIGYQSAGVAFNYLNDIRERAGLTALTATEVPNQSTFRDVILNERFLEFPYEGHRWFDLTRTQTAKAEMELLGKTVQSHQLLWPIPQAEIEKVNNPNILGQNPGY